MIFCRRKSLSPFPLHQSLRLFSSSSSSSSTPSSSPVEYSSFYSVNRDGQSPVYRRALEFKPPTTIKSSKISSTNSVSLIGTILLPVKRKALGDGNSYVWTFLEPQSPSSKSDRKFRILLQMWDELAEISLQHLRSKDFVYVSGHLRSHRMFDERGMFEMFYKVIVKELNYVTCNNQDQTCQKPIMLDRKEELVPVPISDVVDCEKEERDRLRLWQVFFANPDEWWDNRQRKLYPGSPDFRHKDTHECLSLRPNDPPWVRSQLQLLDSRMEDQGRRSLSSARSRVSLWEY